MSLFISKTTVIKESASAKLSFGSRDILRPLGATLIGGVEGKLVDGAVVEAT